jgi:hypothetical protein
MQSHQVQSVPQSLAAILSERKERSRLGLSRFAAEAAEQAAEHRDKLSISGKVKDVADVHKMLWPNQPETNQILNLGVTDWDNSTGEDQYRAGLEHTRFALQRFVASGSITECRKKRVSPKIISRHTPRKVHGRFLRRENFWLQNRAILRKATQIRNG